MTEKWETIRRASGLIEHVCPHGVGHPNVGSVERLRYNTGQQGWDIHGCDGCCYAYTFPGNVWNTLDHTYAIYRESEIELEEIGGVPYLFFMEPELHMLLHAAYEIEDSDVNAKNIAEWFHEVPNWHREEMRDSGMEFMYWTLVALERAFYGEQAKVNS